MSGIPAAHGPWNRHILQFLGDEVRDDLRSLRENAGILRINKAEERLTRRLTVGPGPCLLTCSSEDERLYLQALISGVQHLVRAICDEMPSAPDEDLT